MNLERLTIINKLKLIRVVLILIVPYYASQFLIRASPFYMVSAAIGIVLAIYVFLREEYGIIPLTILVLFPHLIATNMYGIKALNGFNLIFLAISAKIVFNLVHTKQTWIPKVSFLAPLLILFMLELVAGIRCVIAGRLPLDLDVFLTYFLKPLQFFSILFIILFSLKREATMERILVFLAITGMLASFYYIFVINKYLGHVTVHSQILKSQFALGGIQGVAFAIGSFIPVLLLYFYYAQTKLVKTIVISSLMISTYFMFYSFARTIYLSLFISLFYVVYKINKRKLIPFILAVVIFLCLAPNLAINRLLYGTGDHFRSLDEYSSHRLFNWEATADYIGDHLLEIILFGKGEGAFESTSVRYTGAKDKDMVNMYLSLFVRSGSLGIIIFTWMTFAIFRESKFLYNKSDSKLIKVISIGANAILIQFLLQGLTTDFRFFERGKIFLLILLGFMAWFKRQYSIERLNKMQIQKKTIINPSI